MKIEKIKPIPKYILKLIKKKDLQSHPTQDGYTRYYSYLTKNDGELVKVTVAVKERRKKWCYKQVAVHGIHSDECFIKDFVLFMMGNYQVGWYEQGHTQYRKWYEHPDWGTQDDKYFDPWAPIVNKEYLAKFPEYKYAAWELYPYLDILKYLRIYEQYPQVEYVVKLGLEKYADSIQLLRKLGKDKKFRKWIARNRDELKGRYYYISTILASYRRGTPLDETQKFEQEKKCFCRERDFKPIRDVIKGDYQKYFEYIRNNKLSHRLYLDYAKACIYLGLNMDEPKNRYPHDFMRWHDIRIDEANTLKIENDKKERAEFYAKFNAVAEKYLPMQNDKNAAYLVIIAKSPAELKAEGKALHHCVGGMGYEQKFAREETLIFFIRSADAPDVPLVTMEYSLKSKKILQCYANGNTKPADDITTYINTKWLPYAKRQLKKIAA